MRKLILLCMVVSLAMAVDASAAKGKRWRPVRDQDPTSGLESWYFSFGLGGADLQYPDELGTALDFIEQLPGVTRSKYFVDIGLYSPTNQHTVAGIALNVVGDAYEFEGVLLDTFDVRLNQLLIGPSVRRYLGARVGRGLYIRLDGGLARLVEEDSRTEEDATSDWGFGFLGGVGLSWEIFSGTRLSLDGSYTYKHIESENYGAVLIGLSLML